VRTFELGDDHGRLSVGPFCLGTIPYGTGVARDDAFALLDRYYEAGGRFVDTADCYDQWSGSGGESEETIGAWLRSRGVRDEMVIATKVGAMTTNPSDPSEPNFIGLAGKDIRACAEASLRRLGVERIDLYYAHWDHRASALEERVEVFASLVADGKVGVLGCSNTTVWRPDRAGFDVVTNELVDYAKATGVALLGYKPLLRGGYTRADRRPFQLAYEHPSNAARLDTLRKVAAELGVTENQVVLAWMLHSDPPVIPVSAAGTVEQLDEQLAALDLVLDDEVMQRLNTAGTEDGTI
jgi:aryl-alcohol dehydrogenase-like predicted oxidoreductase